MTSLSRYVTLGVLTALMSIPLASLGAGYGHDMYSPGSSGSMMEKGSAPTSTKMSKPALDDITLKALGDLKSTDWAVREKAAVLLGDRKISEPDVISALSVALSDFNAKVRVAAAHSLVVINTPEAIAVLKSAADKGGIEARDALKSLSSSKGNVTSRRDTMRRGSSNFFGSVDSGAPNW